MIKVTGLPAQVTKADLEEIFSLYGTIQADSVSIEVGESDSTAYLALDKNEPKAIAELRNTTWRDNHVLYLAFDRGDGVVRGQSGDRKKP